MPRKDRRRGKTETAVCREVLRQMQLKKFNDLTVTGICDAIDISRRTFYIHFNSIDDVYKRLFEEINAPLYEGFDELRRKQAEKSGGETDSVAMVREIFNLINSVIENNLAYLRRICVEPSYSGIQLMHIKLMKEMIKEYMLSTGIEKHLQQVYLDYYIAGILELYFQWYRGASIMSLEDIRDFACRIIKTDMDGLSKCEEN